VIYRAAAALPYDDRERATAGLRGQLRLTAFADGVTADWSTMVVEGPTEVVGRHDVLWFEWSGAVDTRPPSVPEPLGKQAQPGVTLSHFQ
jgi:hypothetical protein